MNMMANTIRFLAADAVENAGTGHPGMPLGMADLATVLFTRHLKFDAGAPAWADRDRFILSNGHGSMLLYSLLHLTGYEGATIDELKRFRKAHAKAAGHPEYGYLPGIEMTTGPLGQGIATSVGMALGERMLNAEFGDDLVDHRTFVFCGDGCLMEGVSQEAISLAGHLRLAKLTVIFDDNGTTIDGSTDVSTSEDPCRRFEASGWNTISIDGHDHDQIDEALRKARRSERPTLIAARTRIGFGAPTKEGKSVVHGSPLGAAELAGMREALGWSWAAFEVPPEAAALWREAGSRGAADRARWQERLEGKGRETAAEFTRRLQGVAPKNLLSTVKTALAEFVANPADVPVRQASQKSLGILADVMPELVGGSADLTGSVLTRPSNMAPLDRATFKGKHIGYGVREHGMATALNGLALHGGFRPYGGTYFTFSDYSRPALRLAAIMGAGSIFLYSHDSIAVGEDGPTHQPIEHLASLRAMPGIRVYRPADQVEALECWYDAVTGKGPSVMVVARQKVPQVRLSEESGMKSGLGAYVIRNTGGERAATIIATGSEVSIAVAASGLLLEDGIRAAVVSMPCWERFEEQDGAYRADVLGQAPRFVVEAGSSFGWQRYVPHIDNIISVDEFGFSATGAEIYEAFELTPRHVADRVRRRLPSLPTPR